MSYCRQLYKKFRALPGSKALQGYSSIGTNGSIDTVVDGGDSAANPLDYKKVITERSFAKDWKPKYPLYPHQRMRNVVAHANR
eukprot:SAG22_NODE_8281_length_667_cov_4.903169_1_plen_83_part_00